MHTTLQKIQDLDRDYDVVKKAAQYIKNGDLVAFPTETVYGLGANALKPEAVSKIFKAKGRPADNPLIVHIANIEDIYSLVKEVPQNAKILMDAFWPGPLTVILAKSRVIPYEVTAGLETVAIRMPSNPIVRALILESGLPIAAPSANSSGRPSPTAAQHVLDDMEGRIPFIIDGGKCLVGLESTVVDMTADIPVILRPGGITREMIEDILGDVSVDKSVLAPPQAGRKVKSPGMKYTHYAPKAPVTIIKGDIPKMVGKIIQMSEDYTAQGKKVGILGTDETKDRYSAHAVLTMGSRDDLSTIGASLFSCLREFDKICVDVILAEGIECKGEGLAIMNRMLRAAGFHVIYV